LKLAVNDYPAIAAANHAEAVPRLIRAFLAGRTPTYPHGHDHIHPVRG
jgi:hypothetical protein